MKRKVSLRSFLIIVVIFVISFTYKLPYYVTNPGLAQDLEELITVENGYEEDGSFMLTTVRMGKANIFLYAYGMFNKYSEIVPVESVQAKDESDEQYMLRQLHYMDTSKLAAIEVAYNEAELPVSFEYYGIYVIGLVENMPAADRLQLGDRIFALDNNKFTTKEEFVEYVNSKQAGDTISVSLTRDGKQRTEQIVVANYEDEPNKSGIGIILVEDRDIKTTPPVNIETAEIGGPSAGLMFALEIYNQLTEEDFTRGYDIAGTGTIDSEGNIGRIGGIEQKVVAADKSGAKIFFAPFEKGATNSNFDNAVKAAQQINSEMEIVPVDTFQDALQFLKSLN